MINKKNRIFIGPQFIILLGILLIGSILRIMLAHRIPYMGDECGTMMNICYSSKYILTHFHDWLTMNWYILLIKMIAKVFGEGFIAIRFLSIITGIGTILLTGLISKHLFPKVNWLVPAALVSLNPYLITYSAIARVYAVFAFCALLLWLLFIIWRNNPSWINSINLSLSALLLVMINLNGIFILLWLLVIILIEILRVMYNREKQDLLWLGIKRISIPFAFCMTSAGLFYYQLLGEIRKYSEEWTVNKVSSISYAPDAFTMYSGTKLVAWLFLFLLVIGTMQTLRWDRYRFLWISLWIVLPIITAAILGYSFNSWDYARFFIFVLPGIIILSSIGIHTIILLSGTRRYRVVVLLVISGIVLSWLPQIAKQFDQGRLLPFHKVFKYVSEHTRENDRIVSLDHFTYFHLSPYMSCEERAAVEQAVATRECFIHSTIPELMKNTGGGRVFLISSSKNIPTFNLQTMVFGDIRVSILPPEGKEERYTRLLNGYERAAKFLNKDATPGDFIPIYNSLSDLAKFRGDQQMEKHYKSILEKLYSQNKQKNNS